MVAQTARSLAPRHARLYSGPMPRTRAGQDSPQAPRRDEDAAGIDARYGLEPVFEPDAGNSEGGQSRFQDIHCPYCGEPFQTLVDLSAGSAEYIEDCQVCCRPIQFHLDVDHQGRLQRLSVARSD